VRGQTIEHSSERGMVELASHARAELCNQDLRRSALVTLIRLA
jgi:hypothetical protein